VRALLRETKPLLDGFRILARTLPRIDRVRTAGVVGAAIIVAVAQVGLGVTTGMLIGRVSSNPTVAGWTLVLLLMLPFELLILQVGQLAGLSVGQSLKRKVDADLRQRVLTMSLEPIGIAHLEDPEAQALFGAARNLSPFAFTPGDAAMQLATGLTIRLQPLIAAAVLAWFEPLLALYCVALWALSQLLFIVINVRLVMGAATAMASPDLIYLRDLVQEPAAAKEIRVFGLGHFFSDRFRQRTLERIALSLEKRRGHARSYLRAGSVLGVGLAGSFAWLGLQHTNGVLSTGATAICVFSVLNILFVPALFPDIPVMFGVFAVSAVESAEAATRSDLPVVGQGPAPSVARDIRLRGVSFTYPGSDSAVLSDLNLDIPAGQRLAVVGLNGAGKTTLVKLLCRLYDPDAGTIEVDGCDLSSVDPVVWRTRVGVLFQDFIRFHLSAEDNVRLRGSAEARMDGCVVPQAVVAAADRAGVTEIIGELPGGWDTPLHASARGGVDLSGGQWQRLALARALHTVENGAGLLILDEPTANLDPHAELSFFDSVLGQELSRERPVTTILISHRFATVRHADRIVVLQDGRVIEDGTHDELMRTPGAYRTLFDSQADAFVEAGHA
jgi:ATP-binding cassette subfamily B protein